jgi:hypothetical protein
MLVLMRPEIGSIVRDDTILHVLACKAADDKAFLLHGTDSIHDKHVLWPRWLEYYTEALAALQR